MNDDFESLKGLGKKINKMPTPGMIQYWSMASARLPRYRKSQWLQLAAALIAGVLIGKYMFSSAVVAANKVSNDETIEYIYTNY